MGTLSSTSDSAGRSGLARTLVDLFAGHPPRPVEVPEPLPTGGEDRLPRLVRAYLAAPREDRYGIAPRLRFEAESASEREGGQEGLADAIEHLVTGWGDDPAPDLARELVTPAVAAILTARLRKALHDEARHSQLVSVVAPLGPVMARALVAALEDAEDRRVRRVLMDGLVAAAPGAPQVLVEMLGDHRWFVVRNAVSALGEVGGVTSVEHLTMGLAHEHPRVRREAIMALARIGEDDSAQLILGMLDDPDESVRAATAMALGVLGVERAVRPLLERLDGEELPDVQVEILRALGHIGDPGAVAAIEKRARASRFSRTPAPVRIAAYRALAGIGTPHARAVLDEGLEDREPEVRAAVRGALRERA
jgi:HEAT repeat protein